MKFNKRYYRWIAELALILLIIVAARFWMQRDVVSGIAPNINATMLNGQHFELYQNKNRPILVYFWASWCPVCKLQQSTIESVSKEYPVITVAMQSGDDQELRHYINTEKLSFNIINDEYGKLSHLYGIRGVPVAFIVNNDNKINFVEVGYTTELGLRIRLWWASL